MDLKDEQRLLTEISNGNSEAFVQLMKKYQDLVYGMSLKMVKDRSVAEDLTQETWMRVIKKADQYSPVGSVKSWILQIQRNLTIDYFRANKKWAKNEDIDDVELIDDTESIDDIISNLEQRSDFDVVFSKLEGRDKIILTLVIVEELSYSEISRELNLSIGNIKTIVFRAKKELKANLLLNRGGL
jgi:RNA polymerase sigma factor (sigma-70 family)